MKWRKRDGMKEKEREEKRKTDMKGRKRERDGMKEKEREEKNRQI